MPASEYDDDQLSAADLADLAALGFALDAVDTVPEIAVAMARLVPEWAGIDGELIALLDDSGAATAVAGVRSADSEVRTVTFDSGDVAVEVQIQARADGRLDIGGLVAPAGAGSALLHQRDGTVVAPVDGLGHFQWRSVGGGMTWLEFEVGARRVRTSWFLI
jgi:hypothetical protein